MATAGGSPGRRPHRRRNTKRVVVTGPERDDVMVLDPDSGDELWQRAGVGTPRYIDASTVLIPTDGGLTAYDVESGEELWQQPNSTARVRTRPPSSAPADVVLVTEETVLVGYEPRTGEVLWEHPYDTGDSSFEFFHAVEENLVFECIAGTTQFTVRTIDDRSGEVLATVTHDPEASLVGYNGSTLLLSVGSPPAGCIARGNASISGALEGHGLRDGDRRWRVAGEAFNLQQPASRGADDRPGPGLRADVIQRQDPEGEPLGYFFATTGENVVATGNADAIDIVAGQIVTTEITDETVTVSLPDVGLTISGPNSIDGGGAPIPFAGACSSWLAEHWPLSPLPDKLCIRGNLGVQESGCRNRVPEEICGPKVIDGPDAVYPICCPAAWSSRTKRTLYLAKLGQFWRVSYPKLKLSSFLGMQCRGGWLETISTYPAHRSACVYATPTPLKWSRDHGKSGWYRSWYHQLSCRRPRRWRSDCYCEC